MLDILKGKEPTEDILVICRGPSDSFYLFKQVAEIYKSTHPMGNCSLSRRAIFAHDSVFRIRFVGRNEADRAAIGFHGRILYGHQVERILEELGATS